MVGRYIITPDIFDKIRQTEPGVDGELQLTDALKNWMKYMEYSLKARHITLQPVLIGLRHPLNSVLKTLKGMN